MAVGLPLKTTYANGDVYSASDVNDTNGTINITAAPYAAGKNKIINGDLNVWQRGTSFTTNGWTADRFYFDANGTGSTNTVSRQAFTPGAAPIAGYEGNYFLRMARSAAGSGNTYNTLYIQNIENVTTLAGQTATISFFGKADSARTVTLFYSQNFGSGGSGTVSATIGTANLTTSWQRFSITVAIPSISGKTIGTSSFLQITMNTPTAVASTIDVWGFQLEQGSTATAFQTATGTIPGELAACQRYTQVWPPIAGTGNAQTIANASYYSSTSAFATLQLPVEMRVAPAGTFTAVGNYIVFANSANKAATAISVDSASTRNVFLLAVTAASTAGFAGLLAANNGNGYIILSSEL